MLASRRGQPAPLPYIARLTGKPLSRTGGARGGMMMRSVTEARLSPPLTALTRRQATLFQTMRSATQRVIAVTAGLIAAVGGPNKSGFRLVGEGRITQPTLASDMVLRLGNEIPEVPISAMRFRTNSPAARDQPGSLNDGRRPAGGYGNAVRPRCGCDGKERSAR